MTVINARPAEQLNVLPGLRWFFNLRPAVAALVALGFSPLLLWFNDVMIVWGHVLPLHDQYVAALFDSALAVGIGLALWACRRLYFTELPRWCKYALAQRWVHVLIMILWWCFSVASKAASGDPARLGRLAGANSLYHTFLLMPILGYVYTLLVMVMTAHFFTTYNKVGAGLLLDGVSIIVVLVIAAGWVLAAVYDTTHKYTPTGVYKQDLANPRDPNCGGLLTRPLCGPPNR